MTREAAVMVLGSWVLSLAYTLLLLAAGQRPPGSSCKVEGLSQFFWIHREPLWPFSLSAVFHFYQRAALCKLLFFPLHVPLDALLRQDRPHSGQKSPFKAKVGFQLP